MTRARDVANIDGLLTTTGDTYYASAAGTPARLGIGSSAQVLTVSGGVPSWATAAGGGKVLQVVAGTTSTSASNSTTTYADTNLTATITPSAASSKVLVLVSQQGVRKSDGNSGNGLIFQLLRGATALMDARTNYTATALFLDGSWSAVWLDSPSTTSATTYKTQFANRIAAASVSVQVNSDEDSSIVLMEIGA